jgi:hypothetical protein
MHTLCGADLLEALSYRLPFLTRELFFERPVYVQPASRVNDDGSRKTYGLTELLECYEAFFLRSVILGGAAVDIEPEGLERLYVMLGAGGAIFVLSDPKKYITLCALKVLHPLVKLLAGFYKLLLFAVSFDPYYGIPAASWLDRRQ